MNLWTNNTLVSAILAILFSGPLNADTLVHNINGYSISDTGLQQFTAMSYDEQGKVVTTFTQAPQTDGYSQTIDGNGATLLPGLIDAHGHVSSIGKAIATVDVVGVKSEQQAAQRVSLFLDNNSNKDWLWGRGWNQVLWPSKNFPNKSSLDAISGDVAVALNRIDGHALWVNSKALALAGIDKSTSDPAGGQILRDKQGEATGVLIDNAMDLVFNVIPKSTVTELELDIKTALTFLASKGLTSVHDAGSSALDIQAMQNLRAQNAMQARIYAMLDVLDPANDATLANGIALDPQQLLDIRSVKISADGALGSRGAAMARDYSDKKGHRGLLLLSDADLQHHMARAMAAGYQVNAHAIGDLANTKVLNNFEQLQSLPVRQLQRHRVEHAQIVNPKDLPRFVDLAVIASIQPTHATSDKNMAADRIGKKRLKGAYAWRTLIESGAAVAGGSDFPVEPANPFYGLHAAVTRQSRDNQPLDGWMPEQKISREAALDMFTRGAAYAAHQDKTIGQIAPGYWADFILVSDDYFTVKADDIWRNKVLQTYVAGQQVYSSEK